MDSIRVIPTKIHGILDYLGAIALILAPNIFGFANMEGPGIDAAITIPRVLGVVMLIQSIMTRYELGLVKVLPMSMHLTVDVIASLFLAISPFIFGFADNPANVWLPHVVVGVGYFFASLMTKTHPDETAMRGVNEPDTRIPTGV